MTETRSETLIIGAGPAGLQLGHFLHSARRDYLILERDTPGSFFKRFPRHRRLLSINKVHTGHSDPEINLRWDWNSFLSDDADLRFGRFSVAYLPTAEDLVRYSEEFARRCDLRLRCGVDVVRVGRAGGGFVVVDSRGRIFRSDRLVVATGVSEPYVPDIPGIENAEQYCDVSVDPEDFAGQRVLILGKGNSGFETANNLIGTASTIHIASPHPLRMAWESRHVGHLRAVNNDQVDTYLLKSQNVVIDGLCEQIERRDGRFYATFLYTHADGERETLGYDRVICCTGFRFATGIFDRDCQPSLAINERFPQLTSAFESTNIPGLYFAGTLMQALDFKRKQSAFIHGFRYNIRALSRILEARYHGEPWGYRAVPPTPELIAEAILERVNRTSALWQQTGIICDVIVAPRDGSPARHYEEVPTAYIMNGELGDFDDYYTITLEFGDDIVAQAPNPLALSRIHKNDTARAELSSGIHPIVRRYRGDTLLNVHHVIEDIESQWIEDVHRAPLVEYFAQQLALHRVQAGSGT